MATLAKLKTIKYSSDILDEMTEYNVYLQFSVCVCVCVHRIRFPYKAYSYIQKILQDEYSILQWSSEEKAQRNW